MTHPTRSTRCPSLRRLLQRRTSVSMIAFSLCILSPGMLRVISAIHGRFNPWPSAGFPPLPRPSRLCVIQRCHQCERERSRFASRPLTCLQVAIRNSWPFAGFLPLPRTFAAMSDELRSVDPAVLVKTNKGWGTLGLL